VQSHRGEDEKKQEGRMPEVVEGFLKETDELSQVVKISDDGGIPAVLSHMFRQERKLSENDGPI
jgi:hypothetical protein